MQRLRHLVDEAPVGVQRREGILEDHLHVAPRLAQIGRAEPANVPAVEPDVPRGRLDEAQDRASAGRLAAAGLPDERQRLAPEQREADVLDRVDVGHRATQQAAADGKTRREVAHLQQHVGARTCLPGGRRRGFGRGDPEDAHRLRSGLVLHLAELGDGRQERPGIVLLRRGEDVGDRALLDHVAAVHDDDPVGHLGHHGHVVGDEQHRHAVLALEPVDQGQDLGLNRHVERRGGLVGDEQARLAGHRHGDDHALAHAAGQLVRILVEPPLGLRDAHLPEKLQRAGPGSGTAEPLVGAQAVLELAARW